MNADQPRVLILGGGINGAALARELTLNEVAVTIVDIADVASGTTAYSSRLIHGGLRYLEYAEFDLVRESLAERRILLDAAPHLVRPLRLYIPVRSRTSGVWQAATRFFGRTSRAGRFRPRGLWLVRCGLWLYDRFAQTSKLGRHQVHSVHDSNVPRVDPNKYRWLCSYGDAQSVYPELLTLSMLEDARRVARDHGFSFQVLNYHEAKLVGEMIRVTCHGIKTRGKGNTKEIEFRPRAIVNATGAWVDHTLARLHVNSPTLIGGTRGSHIVSSNAELADKLNGKGLYVEADDGRPVFLLPFRTQTLIGTTDVRFEGDPRLAVATDEEVDYLIGAVNDVFPDIGLSKDDVDCSYAGVRPLPAVNSSTTASITRRHILMEHDHCEIPLYSIIGGKITTCRSLAEETCKRLLARLGRPVLGSSRQRPLPGGEHYPADEQARGIAIQCLKRNFSVTTQQVEAIWDLRGTLTETILEEITKTCDSLSENVPGTHLPKAFVRWVIRNQWVHSLDDLVERRLMLVFQPRLQLDSLAALADLLVEECVITAGEASMQITSTRKRLAKHFSKQVVGDQSHGGPSGWPMS